MDKELQDLKRLRDIYKDLTDILDEIIKITENDEGNDTDYESLLGRFIIKSIEVKSLMK